MAEWRIGENLNADSNGRWFSIEDGPNGRYKNYVTSPFESTQNKIKEMYDAQQSSRMNQLKQQRDKAIGGFNQQKADLRPQYQNQRNQADVVNSQNVARLRELMAAQGINASGENLTTQANMASSRQNALSEINNNEQTAMRQIDNQIADWNNPDREQSIISDIEAQRSQAMFSAYQDWQNQMYQREQDWKNYEMQRQQFEVEQKMRELEYQRALAAQAAGSSGGGGGGGRRSSSKKSSSSTQTTATVPDNMKEIMAAYNAYKFEQAMQPAPFQAAQKTARPIF